MFDEVVTLHNRYGFDEKPASELAILNFEIRNNFRFLPEHRAFLTEVANGGHTSQEFAIPTVDCPGGAGCLDGIYGINHRVDHLDLQTQVGLHASVFPELTPFGYDDGNGQLYIDMTVIPGRLLYVPWDFREVIVVQTYHVAYSIKELFEKGAELAAELEREMGG